MQNPQQSQRFKNLLTAAVLGISSVTTFTYVASAAPRNDFNDVREARKDVKEARREVKQERKDVRRADSPQERREERRDVKEARRDVKKAKKDVKQERKEERRDDDRNWGYGHRGGHDRNGYGNGGRGYDYGHDGRGYNRNGYQSFTGTVTDVSSRRFVLRANGQSFDVFPNSGLPRGFDEGDVVRVHGQRVADNNIENASVSMVDNN